MTYRSEHTLKSPDFTDKKLFYVIKFQNDMVHYRKPKTR